MATVPETSLELTNDELKPIDFKLIDVLEQYWLVNGKVPLLEEVESWGVDGEFYKRNMRNRHFRTQLIERGVGIEDLEDPKLVDWALSEKQLAAANIGLDMLDNRSRKRKLSDLDISTQEWAAWLRDPAFRNYLRQRSEALLKDNIHEAHLALIDRVRMGDTNAIKLFYELTGRYIPASARAGQIDPMELITNVMEAIQRHVTDKDTLNKLGTELISMTAASAFAHELDELQEQTLQKQLEAGKR